MGKSKPVVQIDEREREGDAQQVFLWRRARLERAGFDAASAEAIAERLDIDLHLATDLLREGCTPETALRILL